MSVFYFLIIMMLVVITHELGHFIAARLLGIAVVTVSLGFGREIVGFNDRHRTRWRLGWIPLGAYVKPFDVAEHEAAARFPRGRDDAQLAFSKQPVWKRAVVVAAGPFANVVLAVLVYASLNVALGPISQTVRVGSVLPGSPADKAGVKAGDVILSVDTRTIHSQDELTSIVGASDGRSLSFAIERKGTPLSISLKPILIEKRIEGSSQLRWADSGIRRSERAEIGSVLAGLPAEKAGLQRGDIITSIQDRQISNYDDLVHSVAVRPQQALDFKVYRNGKSLDVQITPERSAQSGFDDQPTIRGRIGVTCALRGLGPIQAAGRAIAETYNDTALILKSLWTVATGSSPSATVGGPIAMAHVTEEVAELGTVPLIRWISVLSICLAVINLFPLPVLDGGRLLLLGLEAVRGRPVDRHIEQFAHRVSLALIWTVVVYANVSDLIGLINR